MDSVLGKLLISQAELPECETSGDLHCNTLLTHCAPVCKEIAYSSLLGDIIN